MTKGYLYVANQQKFVNEAILSVKSLKRFNSEPICLVCTSNLDSEKIRETFDEVIIINDLQNHTYMAKVVGLQATPYDRTIFLDGDTFITDTISELFDILDLGDFATTLEQSLHTTNTKNLKYTVVFPEFNSGVIAYRNNAIMHKVFTDWMNFNVENKIGNDMPGLREAILINFKEVRFSILPSCYNEHGFSTMLILNTKVKIIHERLGYKKGIVTPHFLDFESMDKFAKKINKLTYKRLFIPKVGIISFRWSPSNIILFAKKKLGYKRISKSR